jgi:hypothetical protein
VQKYQEQYQAECQEQHLLLQQVAQELQRQQLRHKFNK